MEQSWVRPPSPTKMAGVRDDGHSIGRKTPTPIDTKEALGRFHGLFQWKVSNLREPAEVEAFFSC